MFTRVSVSNRPSVAVRAKKGAQADKGWARKLAEPPAPSGFTPSTENKKKVVEEEPAQPITDFKSDIPKDVWEDESFDLLGKASYIFVPLIALAAIAVGGFAAQNYNDGATSFLQGATSDAETAKVIFLDELLQK